MNRETCITEHTKNILRTLNLPERLGTTLSNLFQFPDNLTGIRKRDIHVLASAGILVYDEDTEQVTIRKPFIPLNWEDVDFEEVKAIALSYSIQKSSYTSRFVYNGGNDNG